MTVLIRAARLLDPASPHHGQVRDLLIENGRIVRIAEAVEAPAATVVAGPGLHVSAGWVDMRASAPDPGHEYRETLRSVREAAAAGGFTEVALLPNTQPVVQTKESVRYLAQPADHPVRLHALAAVTLDAHGKDLTDMMDLHQAGAVAFTDGHAPLQNTDMVLKVLQYLQPFGGLFMNRPEDTLLSRFGTMHEGVPSTMLGMKGMPPLAETLPILRDLKLLEYAGGRLHFSCLSTAESVALVREAKQRGLAVTCDVAAHQPAFTDRDLMQFDTRLKVNPPFRSPADNDALRAGLADGTIDAVVTDHHPLDSEVKNVEFDQAAFGIIGLETAFAALRTHCPHLPLEKVAALLAHNPRRILGLPPVRIAEGEPANLTFFQPDLEWTFAAADIRSLSRNTPFVGAALRGRVSGILHQGRLHMCRPATSTHTAPAP